MEEILRMDGIRKCFGGREVLKGVSLALSEGEVLAVIGPSGSGKSTLLRVAALLERADGGNIAYLGANAAADAGSGTKYASRATLRECTLRFGMVFQSFELFPHMSVLRNLTDAPVHVKKRPRAEAEAKAMELLARVGLADRADAYPYQLSGGEKQRVCIARALAMEPKMLFFDEPTSALDPESTRGIFEIIRALAADGMTMIVVTHQMNFARMAADRVIFIEDGEIVEQGPARDVIDHPANERTRAFLTGGL
jgi:polar amino acid transport system ATP-binding protein